MPEFGRHPQDYIAEKVKAGKLGKIDADLIMRFVLEEAGNEGHTESTMLSSCRYLSLIAEARPGCTKWINDDLNSYVVESRKKFKSNTVRHHIISLRQFSRWLVENNHNKFLDILKVLKIKYPAPTSDKTTSMMLSTEQMDKIIISGKNTRDRCLLSVLTESGARPSEILALRWGDVTIDEYGVKLNVSGKKTKTPRYVRLVHSAPYVGAWKNDHPFKDSSSYVFISHKRPDPNHRITHNALKVIVRDAVERAGIDKKVFPYLFRHSNVTRMMEEGYTDSAIRMQHWGTQKTTMLGTYAHVSNRSLDEEILSHAGVNTGEKPKRESKQVNQCPNPKCQLIVTPHMQFCPKCGTALSEQARSQVQTDEQRLFEQFKKFMAAQTTPK